MIILLMLTNRTLKFKPKPEPEPKPEPHPKPQPRPQTLTPILTIPNYSPTFAHLSI